MCHYWLHTFTVQLPNDSATNLRVAHNVTLVCNLSAAQNRRTALYMACTRTRSLFTMLQTLSDQSQGHLLRILGYINDLTPAYGHIITTGNRSVALDLGLDLAFHGLDKAVRP